MANGTPSEQAVIQVLQAVANYSESNDFVATVTCTLPRLETLLEVSTNDRPTSHHHPDKRQNDNNPRSVIIPDPP